MSTDQSIETTVLGILSTVLDEPVSDLRVRPVLATHDWDSLASLEALAQLENQLNVTLDLRRYHEVRSVADLVGLVASALAAKSPTSR
jgi:acyl carrier protein